MTRRPARRHSFRNALRRVLVRIRRFLPPGTRLPVGLLLMVGGVLGFLPVLGFWMLPLGVAVAALDLVPLWRWLRHRPGPPS
ncbi:MAG: hypothetical protein GYB53_21485 [Rhodobacteraceae bacterium]|nr:hypothetical protein [Paracoccaceae bacterium]MBR9822662.1 hypothetical protein [Paracoccaceae bacterium]